MKLSYELAEKSIISVKDSKNYESESKDDLYIDITNHFSFLRINSKGETCILNLSFGKGSLRDVLLL